MLSLRSHNPWEPSRERIRWWHHKDGSHLQPLSPSKSQLREMKDRICLKTASYRHRPSTHLCILDIDAPDDSHVSTLYVGLELPPKQISTLLAQCLKNLLGQRSLIKILIERISKRLNQCNNHNKRSIQCSMRQIPIINQWCLAKMISNN